MSMNCNSNYITVDGRGNRRQYPDIFQRSIKSPRVHELCQTHCVDLLLSYLSQCIRLMIFYKKNDFFKESVFSSVFQRHSSLKVNRQIICCLFKKSTAFVRVKTFVFSFPRASKSCCPSVDTHPSRSKNVIISRQLLYAVPARSTAQVANLVLPL